MLGGEGLVDYLLPPATERRAQVIETHHDPGGFADKDLYTRGGELLICLVQSGTLEMRLEDERILLHAGGVFTPAPKIRHMAEPLTAEPHRSTLGRRTGRVRRLRGEPSAQPGRWPAQIAGIRYLPRLPAVAILVRSFFPHTCLTELADTSYRWHLSQITPACLRTS